MIYILKKEFKLIFRDIHALLVLFIMPLVFILIMSLALQNSFASSSKYRVALLSTPNKEVSLLVDELNKNQFFSTILVEQNSSQELINHQKYDFVIEIDSNFKKLIEKNSKNIDIEISSKPDIKEEIAYILKNELIKIISRDISKDIFIAHQVDASSLEKLDSFIATKHIFKNSKEPLKVSSSQQSVPAWLIFSMFFILIPISNTFINERNFKTLDRLRSMDISLWKILLSKIVPYFLLNQIQLILMILVGMFIVPLFGGDALVINGSYVLVALLSFAISFAAISFALLVANIAKSTEEATTIGGVANILFAAVAGVMVPKFIMPEFMQKLSLFSPMSWGLEGFLEIFVRGGSFSDISLYLLYLVLFGTISLIVANIFLNRGKF